MDTVGCVDTILRGVGRSIQTSSLGSPRISVEENHHHHGDRPDSNGMSVCSLERDTGTWQAVVRKRCKATANRMCFPPGLKINNRFDELSEMARGAHAREGDRKSWDDRAAQVCRQRKSHDRFRSPLSR